ncbi:alcohol oxidase [Dendrothele bispora CBS 962.96]|uniref:Alcohol oxidase n=1 Tax=Dendrothele bispora (strain CBS 962.96) TaxID=1314807 RepID=A0A4S8L3J8_DENBC|nr:alcohol oxidase [Dendrothele bispora CBS 962.96]
MCLCLTIASRLSENSSTSVLVLEAGQIGDAVASQINEPAKTYYDSLMSSQLDWPRGKVLGGSSAVNGMYLVRPIIEYNADSYGTDGPIHWGYPGFTFPIPSDCKFVSINNTGSFIANSAIRESDWTRSYSRSGYIDSIYTPHILTGATVTGIVWDGSSSSSSMFPASSSDLKATGVQYALSSTSPKQTVNVNKEVILSAGTIGSAQILMVSGIGPKSVLQDAGVDVKVDLPGVGQRLQDHLVTSLAYSTTSSVTTAGSIHTTQSTQSQSPEFMSFINSATAYLPLSSLFPSQSGSSLQSLISSAQSSMQSQLQAYKTSGYKGTGSGDQVDDTVVKGYQSIYTTITDTLYTSPSSGQIELLIALTQPNTIVLQAAIQHPLSMGRMYITSNDVFVSPVLDPAYLQNNVDLQILRQGVKMLDELATSSASPLSQFISGRTNPPAKESTSDDDWDSFILSSSSTEFHPSSSCAALPLSLGGVVDPDSLRVYGAANVRVMDASVFPMEMSTHLGAPTYGVGEIGVGLVRATYEGNKSGSGVNATDNSSSGSGNGSGGSGGDSNSAMAVTVGGMKVDLMIPVGLGLLAFVLV